MRSFQKGKGHLGQGGLSRRAIYMENKQSIVFYGPWLDTVIANKLTLALRKLLLDSEALKLRGYRDKDLTFYVAPNETHRLLYRKLTVLIPTLPQVPEYVTSQVPGFMDLDQIA